MPLITSLEPMDGFVPSYNLQVAVSVLTVEALKQRIAC